MDIKTLKLFLKVNIKNITYAGNHGLDIVHPDGTKFVPPLPEEVNSIYPIIEVEK